MLALFPASFVVFFAESIVAVFVEREPESLCSPPLEGFDIIFSLFAVKFFHTFSINDEKYTEPFRRTRYIAPFLIP